MTDAQFLSYVTIEVEARADESYVSAAGVASAIAGSLGDKKALQRFRKSLLPGSGPGGDSPEVSELRRRIGSIVSMGAAR